MHKTIHQYDLYILTNKTCVTLYIGVTNNLERRMFEYKNKLVEGFTKKWKRQWKIDLIEKDNLNWKDLSKDWTYLIE